MKYRPIANFRKVSEYLNKTINQGKSVIMEPDNTVPQKSSLECSQTIVARRLCGVSTNARSLYLRTETFLICKKYCTEQCK
ncbi:hypothetical protein GJ496_000435 [Pomphorhynchus laevis]|nr:hypothetical protein GJ496_000435 [Pomphorhynchus laevis]